MLCLYLVSVLVLSACGRNEDEVPWEDQPSRNLHFASAEELARGDVVPASYLVAFKNLLDQPQLRFASYRTSSLAHFEALSHSWAQPSLLRSLRYFSTLNFSRLSESFSVRRKIEPAPWLLAAPSEDERLASLVEVKFRSAAEAEEILSRWYEEGRIWYAEPNYLSDMKGELEDRLVDKFGGENVDKAPWLEQLNFVQAIEELGKLEQKPATLIAVMDSGADIEHPNLKDAIYQNQAGQNKLQCKDDLYGCDVTQAKKDLLGTGSVWPSGTKGFNEACPPTLDACEHGTHVAGIIAARDSEETVGICPYCRLLIVKIVGPSEEDPSELKISDAAQLAGLSYISGFQDGGEPLVRVINASYGRFTPTRSVELFMKALKNFGRGVLTVAAAGNEDTIRRSYPASYEDVMAVSNVFASQKNPRKSISSNFGMWVDIAAPGDYSPCPVFGNNNGIPSTLPNGKFGCKVGTSMATPVVVGVAGLVLTKEPNLTAEQLEQRLKDTAIPDDLYRDTINNEYRPTIDGFVVPLLGSGVVNAYAALRPDRDISPSLSTDRPDRVEPGCGVLGAASEPGKLFSLGLMTLPLLCVGLRRRRDKI